MPAKARKPAAAAKPAPGAGASADEVGPVAGSAAGSVARPTTAGSAARSATAAATAEPASDHAAPGRIPVRVGVGGPVGAGKTALISALCLALGGELSMAVVTNDAFTAQDAETLRAAAVLDPERITAVRTGCGPQAAIRDDIAGNLDAVEALEAAFHPLDLVLVESGGDDLSSSFSKGLIDRQIFVIDVAAGPQVPRKGGPGITFSDLLVVNKTDLAPYVDADLDALRREALARRQNGPGGTARPTAGPVLFTSLREHPDAPAVADWVRGLITERRSALRG